MKTKLHSSLVALFLLLLSSSVSAQQDITNLFKGGINDLNKIANGYLAPAGTAFAAGLGSNWYNTAKTHSVLGFDLTAGLSVLTAPSSQQSFSLLGLSNLSPVPSGATTAPSFVGKGDGTTLELKSGGRTITSFSTPSAVSQYVPQVNLQFTLGLPLGNDITVRYSPKLKYEGLGLELWGVGLKHDIKQWIPVVKRLPFDAAIVAGYTKFKQTYDFPVQLTASDLYSAGVAGDIIVNPGTPSGQGFEMESSSLMANLVVSKRIAFFTPYIGFGLNSVHYDFAFKGVYPILGNPDGGGKIPVQYVTDPIDVKSDEMLWGGTVGFRLKFLVVAAFHAQYTLQKYPTASVGFGFSFR